ncbi:hypothetical protein M406DRAFT_295706 [Cryphonectria parasitica EP155]|uniref:Vegetative cell wall protein gp1 n=1 Tax=Cryphonectria parasitica (strain ATCC 38755 / EP155) TaxID=660469 RepID=A0A9P4XVC9_CRYP1|nr:uncharacterized protein M406DRAFT_295706 [Cryphonectria parasitica EP155]KAF3761977.1 hypothetical protein M406DRAFT_295706 [Cryphonectria parasitica EP155]
MNGQSPYGSTPGAEYYYEKDQFATPTPSPRGPVYYYASTPQRPQTRAHFRHVSCGVNDYPSPRPAAFSPRYNSEGHYSTNAATANTRYYEEPRRPAAHARRASQSMPQRPQTARPSGPHQHKAPPATRKATEADATNWGIPKGYSLKNWDPTEEPILLLGSVFDANSLGKWVYDWTVYSRGSSTPISEVAGELWLLLIQLAGKIKRATEAVPRIRTQDNKEMFEGFISSGQRLTDKLQKLLKLCEKPMLTAGSKKDAQLGQRSGIEFVQTLFGRDRELNKTEKFMQSVRLWNLRFDANCEDVLRHPEQ